MVAEAGALQDFLDLWPFLGIYFEDPVDEVDLFLDEVLREEYWLLHFVQNVILGVAFKRSLALYEFEEENAESPGVDFVIIGLAEDHLGGHVLDGAAKGHPGLAVGGESEVADLDIVLAVEEDVFGLSGGGITLMSRCMMFMECM